jgi:hypothetical protein
MSILAALIGLCLLGLPAAAQDKLGRFEGEVVAKFMRDGRNMKLEKPFAYVDPRGMRWDVPAGTVTDGASIPRVLWTAYPPFTGNYREAAVIHDYYCQTRSRPWRDTHGVFYHAMRTAGVEEQLAKTMYATVLYLGPRWGAGAARGAGSDKALSRADEDKLFKELEAWVKKANPSLEEIGRRLETGAPPR